MAACTPHIAHDGNVAACAEWCKPGEAHTHCGWCKCKACSFCQKTSHVYATAGSGTVVCDAGALTPIADLAGIREMGLCQKECDGDSSCRAYTFHTNAQRCALYLREPQSFCSKPGSSTFWRVDIPSDGDSGVQPQPQSQTALQQLQQTQLQRVLVHGKRLIDSASGEEIQLHGVNMYLDYYRRDDMALMNSLLPSVNLVRLVGVFWHDAATEKACKCCTDDEREGYFAQSCLESLQEAVGRITAAGKWVIIAAKARYAAGEDWPRTADVFHDEALAAKYARLWAYLAEKFKGQRLLAGYEVMSEPRNKQIEQAARTPACVSEPSFASRAA